MSASMIAIDGEPLSPEAVRMLDYLKSRTAALGPAGIRERVHAAAAELQKVVASVSESDARLRPLPGKWNIAEVVDHIAQTQIRSAEELRHLLAGRRPPGPPVYEALRTGAPAWAPWAELVEGLHSANEEFLGLLSSREPDTTATVRTILVVMRAMPDGTDAPQIFVAELDWKEYALLQRLHLLDHRTQIKNLRNALHTAVLKLAARDEVSKHVR